MQRCYRSPEPRHKNALPIKVATLLRRIGGNPTFVRMRTVLQDGLCRIRSRVHQCRWSPCLRESNAAQTAGTGEQTRSWAEWRAGLISVSTLTDNQIYPRAGFLLSQSKNESHIELLKWAIYFIQPVWSHGSRSKKKMTRQSNTKGCENADITSLCLWITLLEESSWGFFFSVFFFWQTLQNYIREEGAFAFASRARGFSLNQMRGSIRCTVVQGPEGNN